METNGAGDQNHNEDNKTKLRALNAVDVSQFLAASSCLFVSFLLIGVGYLQVLRSLKLTDDPKIQRQSSRPKKAAGGRSGIRPQSAPPPRDSGGGGDGGGKRPRSAAGKPRLDTRGPGSSRPPSSRGGRAAGGRKPKRPAAAASKGGGGGGGGGGTNSEPAKIYAEILRTVDQAVASGVSEDELLAMCTAISGAGSALAGAETSELQELSNMFDRELSQSAHA